MTVFKNFEDFINLLFDNNVKKVSILETNNKDLDFIKGIKMSYFIEEIDEQYKWFIIYNCINYKLENKHEGKIEIKDVNQNKIKVLNFEFEIRKYKNNYYIFINIIRL